MCNLDSHSRKIACQIYWIQIILLQNKKLKEKLCFQGGHIIFFQSLSLLGYCLFPLDVGALICMVKDNVILKVVVVSVTLAWSSWAAYPFMSSAVNPRRKALALYPVFLLYVSVGFLIIAIDQHIKTKHAVKQDFCWVLHILTSCLGFWSSVCLPISNLLYETSYMILML